MSSFSYIRQSPGARVLIVSQREVAPRKSRCAMLEFEDLVADIDSVDMISAGELANSPASRLAAKVGRTRFWPSGIDHSRGLPARGSYDLVLIICNSPAELYRFGRLRSILACGRQTACFFEEIWNHDLERRTGELKMLRGIDHLFVGMESTVAKLRNLTGKEWHFLAPGVNTDVLSPELPLPEHRIDVWAMGRRRAGLHPLLREVADRTGRFYLYDTTGNDNVHNYKSHRSLLAELAHRTRYFCVDCAKSDVPAVIGRQEEVGSRFFEGAATGTIMVGHAPQCRSFTDLFGWEDSVIPLPHDADGIINLFDSLDANPARVETIRRRNIAESLRRHDGAHRWATMLDTIGLERLPALKTRLEKLDRRAHAMDPATRDHRGIWSATDPAPAARYAV